MTLDNGAVITGCTSQEPDGILGLSDYSGFVLDEAGYCSEQLYLNACDRLRGQGISAKIRLISTPNGTPTNNWYQRLVRDNSSKVIYGSSLDNCYTSDEYKQGLKDRYIEGSLLYRQQVLGEIIESEFKTAIVFQKDFANFPSISTSKDISIGIDFAGDGADSTVIVVINENKMLFKIKLSNGEDHYKIIEEVEKIETQFGKSNIISIVLDNTGGFGKATYDTLKYTHENLFPIHFAMKSKDEMCNNIRTYMYSYLADSIKSGFYIDKTEFELMEELKATQFVSDNKGKRALIPKDQIKKIIGNRSPDTADSLALAKLGYKLSEGTRNKIDMTDFKHQMDRMYL